MLFENIRHRLRLQLVTYTFNGITYLMRLVSKLLSALGLALILATGALAETISPPEAAQYVGATVTVEGVVSQVSTSNKGTVFINFGGRFPNHVFYAVIFNNHTNLFPGVRGLEGRTVAINGKIKWYKGKPEIILSSPSELEVR